MPLIFQRIKNIKFCKPLSEIVHINEQVRTGVRRLRVSNPIRFHYSADPSTMNSSHPEPTRPATMWLDDKPDWAKMDNKSRASQTSGQQTNSGLNLVTIPATRPTIRVFPPKIRQTTEDPWQTYESVVEVFLGRSVCLAHRRAKKAELVNKRIGSRIRIRRPWRSTSQSTIATRPDPPTLRDHLKLDKRT